MTLVLDAASVKMSRRLAQGSAPPRGAESILMQHVRRFEIDYFGAAAPTDAPAWHRQWSGIAHLPQLVRITLDADDRKEKLPILVRLPNAD